MWTKVVLLYVLMLSGFAVASPRFVVEDDGVGLTLEELEQIVSRWTPQMRAAAAKDKGDRLELLNVALVSKKMAIEADRLTPEEDGDVYWDYVLTIRTAKQRFLLKNFMDTLEIPDMSEVAKERYAAHKEKYAKVPEQRISSHILFKCLPGQCDRNELKAKAQLVLDELRQGADFAEMVQKYSDDASTRAKGGVFNKWMELGETGVSPPYSGAVFEIERVGDYAELTETQFGVHIIRLDGIREEHFLPFEEVRDQIVGELEREYKKLAVKEFNQRFILTDKAKIDGPTMEAIFGKYNSAP